MDNYYKVFGISENYTLAELKQSYINIIKKLYKSDKTKVEKEILEKEYTKMYKYCKGIKQYKPISNFNSLHVPSFSLSIKPLISPINYMHPVINSLTPHNNISNIVSYSKIFNSKLNPDGTRTIIETEKTNNNGKKEQKTNTYKQMPDGKKIPIKLI